MNLFVASMLVLVLADNLLLLYLGWEGVGLCSYLLIGFWYKDPANGRAARKAFLVTRIGDTSLAVGLFLLFTTLGTLNIAQIGLLAAGAWPVGGEAALVAALLILGGAVGKSAQLPLQTWLPDAMAGPTPVSALIHAATMVTAGVYLVARMHAVFELAPLAQAAVAAVGAVTLLYAACSALAQRDIKRVLAYSTMSQVGYMFLALGVGAWSAAMLHFMMHAFFKALLFLGAGAVILAMHHEHDMFRMGGLRRSMPLVFWTFVIGAASLAGLPLVTAGFYSKDMILAAAWAHGDGGRLLWAAGVLGAFITALYAFRMVIVTFMGSPARQAAYVPGWRMGLPLVVLAVLAIVGGFIQTPGPLGGINLMDDFLAGVFRGQPAAQQGHGDPLAVLLAPAAASIAGILLAWLLYARRPAVAAQLAEAPLSGAVRRWWLEGWGFDRLYDWLLVRPVVWVAHLNRHDFIDRLFEGLAAGTGLLGAALRPTQSGRVRWYAAAMLGGAAIILLVAMLS
jgi:NADH-quinone oxidoreductase subunit L